MEQIVIMQMSLKSVCDSVNCTANEDIFSPSQQMRGAGRTEAALDAASGGCKPR